MIETLIKVATEGIYLKIITVFTKKLTPNIILNSEKVKTFPLSSGTRQECPPHHFYTIQHCKFQLHQSDRKKN